jgi:hypothetical protein
MVNASKMFSVEIFSAGRRRMADISVCLLPFFIVRFCFLAYLLVPATGSTGRYTDHWSLDNALDYWDSSSIH